MKRTSMFWALISVVMFALAGCSDEPGADDITRVKDGDGKVFLEKGGLTDANLKFSPTLLTEALENTDWELQYLIIYDNHLISDKFEVKDVGWMPVRLSGGIAEYTDGSTADFSVLERMLTVVRPPWSSTWTFDEFTIVAVDYLEGAEKRIIMDRPSLGLAIPDSFDRTTATVRTVWKATR